MKEESFGYTVLQIIYNRLWGYAIYSYVLLQSLIKQIDYVDKPWIASTHNILLLSYISQATVGFNQQYVASIPISKFGEGVGNKPSVVVEDLHRHNLCTYI